MACFAWFCMILLGFVRGMVLHGFARGCLFPRVIGACESTPLVAISAPS